MKATLLLLALSLAAGGCAVTPRPEATVIPTTPTPPASLAATAPAATATAPAASPAAPPPASAYRIQEFAVPPGSAPHDVAPARDGGVWYTAQRSGALGWLDPTTGRTKTIPLGRGSAPHGVITDRDGHPWLTDGGLNAIVRVDAGTSVVTTYPLPAGRPNANLNTAAFDSAGVLWFTGQNGIYGRLDPQTGAMEVFDAPRGRGPYGIAATPSGEIYYASLAGNHVARIDTTSGAATVLEPPTAAQGARRVWSDSKGNVWVSEWNAGQLGVFRPATQSSAEWKLPGTRPQPYAVYVDERDGVWVSDWGANAMVRFDPDAQQFTSLPLPTQDSTVRQILGRPGEVWLPLSGVDKLAVIRLPERTGR